MPKASPAARRPRSPGRATPRDRHFICFTPQVVRYPWYAASLAGGAPNALTWARYSAFLPLYPVGVVSEMWLVYKGLPAVRQRQLHSVSLPHPWNFAFDYSYFLMVSCFLMGGSAPTTRRKFDRDSPIFTEVIPRTHQTGTQSWDFAELWALPGEPKGKEKPDIVRNERAKLCNLQLLHARIFALDSD